MPNIELSSTENLSRNVPAINSMVCAQRGGKMEASWSGRNTRQNASVVSRIEAHKTPRPAAVMGGGDGAPASNMRLDIANVHAILSRHGHFGTASFDTIAT